MIISRRSQSYYFYYSVEIKGRNHLMVYKNIRHPAMEILSAIIKKPIYRALRYKS